MRDTLAERILATVMSWNAEDLARELPYLQALSSIKYDEYQRYSPGIKFFESLGMWLYQFESLEERKTAYEFVKTKLIFISNAEINHIVSIAYPDKILPFLLKRVAKQISLPESNIRKIIKSERFNVVLRQSLFVGLSDGAHLDIFRRSNPQLSNEQVLIHYDASDDKIADTIKSLKTDLHDPEAKFHDIFLIDDFSASGLSYIRTKGDGSYGGKITKILTKIYSDSGEYAGLVDKRNMQVSVLIYIATTKARIYLEEALKNWISENRIQDTPSVFVVHELSEKICVDEINDGKFVGLLQKYFDESILDEHYTVGGNDKPYLGFNGCALPVILTHNTPNNSIPLLWFDTLKYTGLFPRVSRHKGNAK